jgi:hypothetical protein
VVRYKLDVEMLVDSWVYGGITDLMKKMPEGVLGVNVIGIKKQEVAWDATCLPCTMKDYEESQPRDEQLYKPSPTERPRHEWDSLVDAMDVRVEAHKNNMSIEDKLKDVRKRLKFLNEGIEYGSEGCLELRVIWLEETGTTQYTLQRMSLRPTPPCIVTDSVDILHDYVFNQLEPNRKEQTKSKKELSEKEEMARLESLPSELADNFPTTWKLRFDTKFASKYGYWDIKVDKDSYYFCYFCNGKELSKVYFSSPSMNGVVDYLKKVWRFDFCEELR